MKEIKQKIIDEELDIYDVHARPVGEEQEKLSKEIEKEFQDVLIEHHLYEADDYEKAYDIILNSW